MRAGTKSFMVLAAAVLAVCCAVAAGRWLRDNKLPNFSRTAEIFIYPGTTADSAMTMISAQAGVRSGRSLARTFRKKQVEAYITPGHYTVAPGNSSVYVARMLNNGWQTPVRVTLSGNLRLKGNIAAKISSQLLLDSASVRAALDDDELLSRYGTHYVTTSTLGGYLDYYFSSSVDKISDTLDVNATIGFGYATTFNLNADVKYKDAFESFGEDKIESFLVKGGDAITLTNAVVAKTINNAALDAWLASFGGVEDDQGRLELINFEVNGIYELFPSDIKTKIRNYIERVMYYNDLPVTRSGNQDSFQN